MELPIAIQTALDESERQFEQLLSSLGLTRDELTKVAGKIRKSQQSPPQRPAPGRTAAPGRRIYHV